ncbi:histone deacetylase complex protein [Crucibulum laeve]|uniref:histone deacetylase n=1 Tax=Crucibulum laeve TaxID=68775 RepID=A0A5C3MK58_9AGAR|nr:histone deacetylase complex protein [Crucibulum laeve]
MDNTSGPQSDAMDVDLDATNNNKAGPASPPRRPSRSKSVPLTGDHSKDYNVGYIYSAEMTSHFNPAPAGHPEQPARIESIWKAIVNKHYTKKMQWLPIRPVRKEEVLLVHSESHWDTVQAIQHLTDQQRADSEEYYEQLSLYVMAGTTRAALLSCGGVVDACLAVARNQLQKTFAIVRPPGHHAEPTEHMGFCFFNNVAVAARVVQQLTPIKRIMILDWDVHHGNGTQRAFNDDPTVLYVSIHRYDQGTYYPCGPFGSMQSCGEGPGLGYSVNIPWPIAGMGDADYIHAFQKVVMPIAMEFAPELVISFDAAEGDDLGECFVSPAGYAHMTHMLSGLASGRLVVALEGGYNLESISNSAVAVTGILLGEAPEELPAMTATEAATETVWQVAREQSKYWKSIDPKTCEPQSEFEDISFSIPEILKAHRQYYLYTRHDMMQVPLVTPELEERFSSQIMCTSDIFENNTLVLFIHEFGNLRMELESSMTCDVELERSYLIDFSKKLISWVKDEGFSLLDANLFPKPSSTAGQYKPTENLDTEILIYLWDNYVQLSSAQRVILIGHGPGCRSLVDLMNRRAVSIMKSVKAVIQVVGRQKAPKAPSDSEELGAWYRKHSLLIMPATHGNLAPLMKPKEGRKHGNIISIEEPKQLKLIMLAMPSIKDFVKECLDHYPLLNVTRTNNLNNISY